MRFIPLASGSKGNAALAEFGRVRILLDAGISAKRLTERIEGLGLDPGSIDAILLTHEHEDHARGAKRFSRLHRTPVLCGWETLEAMDASPDHFAEWQPLAPGEILDLGAVTVEPFPVPHDAANPVGFVVRGEGLQVGLATDLGHATTLVLERLRGCHLVMVESNHDDRMLMEGPYPWHLKQRVSGRWGHLSNHETAALLSQVVDERCRAVVLSHLSEHNNAPGLARRVVANALAARGCSRVEMRIATAAGPTPAIEM